jgi:hypothetical protein
MCLFSFILLIVVESVVDTLEFEIGFHALHRKIISNPTAKALVKPIWARRRKAAYHPCE